MNFAAKKNLDAEDLMHLQEKDKTIHQRDKFLKEWDREVLAAKIAGRPPSFT